MTNFEACAVLHGIRERLAEGIKTDKERIEELKKKPADQCLENTTMTHASYIKYHQEDIAKSERAIRALDKAGAALTKRG